METTFQVSGMTCDHCIAAVTAEILRIPGVQSVAVDLVSGAVTVDAPTTVDRSAVAAAVDEAGYELA